MAKKERDYSIIETRTMVRPYDLAIMMWHLKSSAVDPEIGNQDADHDLNSLVVKLKQKIPCRLNTAAIESALYCCNMMDEAGKFWHPEGHSFEKFLKDVVFYTRQHSNYDRFYNFFETKKEAGEK